MSVWGKIKSGLSKINPFAERTEGQYAGVDKGNFDLPGADERSRRLLGLAGTAAPQASDSEFRANQAALIQRLQAQMNGKDSMSAVQLRQNADRNIAQAQGFAASARPGGAQLASLNAATNAGAINQGLAGQQAIAGIAERNAAAEALGNVAANARGQDLQNSQFNVGANLQQQGINQGWSAQDLQNAQLQQQGGESYEANRTARAGAQLQQPTWGEQLIGAGLGAAKIAAMAKGGVVTRPTRAIIGESGPEAVIPLAKLPAMMKRLKCAKGKK